MIRGEVWWAALGKPVGSGPGYHRPALIVQGDDYNRSTISTVIVAVVTSNLRLGAAAGNVTVSEQETGLPRRSVINVSQIVTIDRSLLIRRVGMLSSRRMEDVDAGLRRVLALS